ncbi:MULTISPECIES: hypothetical protein [unclassified Meiothermus]|uniref:hypothetical protein n=1 Tax=unclassified Meiothermus TaxID=370471 RepID=UPI000D7BED54|nr:MULTISPECIES: hypothetical protein [unclassified Meiothermus]PZA08816.1 hypothetical protein DNA98_01895 [Meiothermus sp. Pnk-1]RYM40561.1 hypothetical protein EWH23_00045 [Meiothermus sp. PNK-Is4]
MFKAAPRYAYVHRMDLPPLERLVEASPLTRQLLQQVWEELSPRIKALCPERHQALCQAFALRDLPLEVLASYFLREARRALERLPAEKAPR